MVQFDEDKQKLKIDDLHKKEEEELAQLLASRYGISYIDLLTTAINTDALGLIKEEDARRGKLAAFGMVDKKIKIAVLSPKSDTTKEVLTELTERGYTTQIHMTSTASLEKAWNTYKDVAFAHETKAGALEISNQQILEVINQVKSVADIKKLIEELLASNKSYRISKILEIILAGSLSIGASDVHIEPEEKIVRIRYRLDGVLTEILTFDSETFGLLLSRIKLLSGLKLNVKQDAQDGRFSIKLVDTDIEIRTSVLPGAYGESIVLRVLNPKNIAVPLEELGIHPKLLKLLEQETERPDGMILTTGPTGSGKTTTLYAFLRRVYSPGIKIITIEDPIEYHLPGIVQTQTNDKGYNFLDGLRSALRQDPDVIMVGEIRDAETAAIAINSAQTGHLVFSTLHTNNAAGAFPRLIDLKINPKVLTSAINISLAQRLLRKLCIHCKKEITIEGDAKTIIDKVIVTLPPDEKSQLTNTSKMWVPAGCEKCNSTGYKGRIGIYEAILTDEAVEQVVINNPSEREIKKAAIPQGILTMEQDGVIKILSGVTALDELARVIDVTE